MNVPSGEIGRRRRRRAHALDQRCGRACDLAERAAVGIAHDRHEQRAGARDREADVDALVALDGIARVAAVERRDARAARAPSSATTMSLTVGAASPTAARRRLRRRRTSPKSTSIESRKCGTVAIVSAMRCAITRWIEVSGRRSRDAAPSGLGLRLRRSGCRGGGGRRGAPAARPARGRRRPRRRPGGCARAGRCRAARRGRRPARSPAPRAPRARRAEAARPCRRCAASAGVRSPPIRAIGPPSCCASPACTRIAESRPETSAS